MQRLRVVLDEVMRSAVEVVDRGGVRINAKRVVQRGVHLAKGDRPFTGLSAEAVGRADDLPMLESAAGEQAAGDSRPVVAAGILVDGWCAAEFAPANHDDVLVETPLVEMDAPVLSGKKVVLVSILRAGDGILSGMVKLLPSARVGHIGLYRDPKTLVAVEYYFKIPEEIDAGYHGLMHHLIPNRN